MGAENGQAVCLSRGPKEKDLQGDTITPFGRAYYQRQADFFVIPFIGVLFIGVLTAVISAAYWSISAVAVAQALRQLQIHLRDLRLFKEVWYRFALLYSLITLCFVCVLNIQAVLAMIWVILMKWLVIGQRKEGPHLWDKSNYCESVIFGSLIHKFTSFSHRPTMAIALGFVKTAQQGLRELRRPWLNHRYRLYCLVLPSPRSKGRGKLLARCRWACRAHDRTRSRRVGQ